MSVLQTNEKIGKYEVRYPIKENRYCETYRVEDDNENPFFLKLFIKKNVPEKMLDENGNVRSIVTAERIAHKNIVSFVESGMLRNEQFGECQYAVTNYFSGELLADKLQREGKLPKEEATRIFNDILDGLQYLHQLDLFHNDITPHNIMLSERTGGAAEIIDLSHVSGYIGGAPKFDTSDLDERYQAVSALSGMYNDASDVFSALAVYFTMLTGRTPWDADIPRDLERKERIKLAKRFREKPLNVDDIDDEGLRNIFVKGLTGKSVDQYRSVAQLRKALADPSQIDAPANTGGGQQAWQKGDQQQQEQSEEQANVEIHKGDGNGFQDIAGMNDLKKLLSEKVIFILKDKERAEKYRLTPPNGMLLYGPPGCGKSFFAEKFAEETRFNFILVKASDLGSIYVHGSQGKIADLFKKAEENAPTVICFDEFDAFVPDRSGNGADHQAGEVNEFLTQLNNCSKRGIFVIATSNRPDKIDPAILRTGRIDRQIYVPLPDHDARREMFALHLKGRPCEDIDTEKLATMTEGYIASDIAYIVNDAAMGAAFSDRPITQELLEMTINSIRPSINQNVIKVYDDIRNRMEGINHKNALPHIGFTHY